MRVSRICLLATAAVALTMASCDGRKVYDSFAHTPLSGWERNDTVTFCVPAVEEEGTYGLFLNMRTANNFPFTNITMIINRSVSPSGLHCADTMKCVLADRGGHSTGKGINIYQYRFRIASDCLEKGNSLCVKVNHNMRREILPGIADVGLTVERER